jgi:hypothetical protein
MEVGDLMSVDAEKLLAHCEPAPFGDLRTQKTIFDPSVRVAFEKRCEDVRICTKDKEGRPKERTVPGDKTRVCSMTERVEWITYICYKIEKTFGREIDLIPNKLNVYGPGGFFRSHVDTPADPEKTIGSLVVCLPTEHSGGELVVTHGGSEQVFDFAARSDRIQWAAFYSDCVHEVRPITEGFRVTVTFSIVSQSKDWMSYGVKDDDFWVGPQRADEHGSSVKKFEEIVREIDGENVAVLLSHQYTYKGLSAEGLKGTDRTVLDAIRRTGKRAIIHPVAMYFTQETPWDTGVVTKNKAVYLFDHDDLLYLLKKGPRPVRDWEDREYDFYDMGGARSMRLSHTPGAEWTDNEVHSIYFHAAIFIIEP